MADRCPNNIDHDEQQFALWESSMTQGAGIEEAAGHAQAASPDSEHGVQDDIARFLNDGDDTESDLSKDEERKHKNREAAAHTYVLSGLL
ncbi:hypothetical protein P43SY_003172 [Pythium insidiosum]|uniref:Uncharacterized protein n=1 Tax=Pythium insidiosum TaxID=114742 RepID=A0AAD5LH51_PYTIN|nr:hypothetical protein P43SY_003172 [Pythium insidiosum]